MRYRKTPETGKTETAKPQDAPQSGSLPRWLTETVKPDPARAQPITPSGFLNKPDAHDPAARAVERRSALLRGTVIHRLMQSLPEIAPEHRANAARRYLARARGLDETERDAIARHVL